MPIVFRFSMGRKRHPAIAVIRSLEPSPNFCVQNLPAPMSILFSMLKDFLRGTSSGLDAVSVPPPEEIVSGNIPNEAERVLYGTCPLCDSTEIVSHKTGNCSMHPLYQLPLSPTIKWMRCAHCNHIFTEGYYSEEASKIIISRTNEHQKLGYDFENQRVISSRMIEKVLPYASSGIWLDVGFGNGSLLFTAKEYGFTPVGTDLRPDNVSEMNSLGIQAYCVELEKLEFQGRCNVVSMADLLEHTAYPKRYLRAAHRLLSDEGILFLSMPNTESIVWQVYDQQGKNPYWGEIEHYHNFGRSRLYSLLMEEGFVPVRFGISERYQACMEVIARRQ